ncbi:MAG: hypothetical protein H7249_16035 [Chitinophagaceae bacterium]|nr:hypothetical protein [Oligoflexus sp.]
MNRGVFGVMMATSLVVASPAWAIFNAQVLTGKRSSKFSSNGRSSDTLTGSELRAAAHIDPIPLVPIAFGIAASQTTFDTDSSKLGINKIDGTDIDLEIEAWLPLELAGLVPYAKVGYTIAGTYDMEVAAGTTDVPKIHYKPTGASFHVGLKYEFLLRLGVMAEFETATRKLKYDKITDAGVFNNLNLNDVDQNSTSILIGVQAGI